MGFMDSLMKTFAIPFIMEFFTQLLSKENFEVYGDKLFDFIEDMVADSETNWDDLTVLPVVKILRENLGIPDRPDVEE